MVKNTKFESLGRFRYIRKPETFKYQKRNHSKCKPFADISANAFIGTQKKATEQNCNYVDDL